MIQNRRQFLETLSAGAIVAINPFLDVAMAEDNTGHTLVVIFLRGGMDGLQLLAPANDADLKSVRSVIWSNYLPWSIGSLPRPAGSQPAGQPPNVDFLLHQQAAPLLPLYMDKSLCFVHAVGQPMPKPAQPSLIANPPTANHSHFICEKWLFAGGPTDQLRTGWLTNVQTDGEKIGDVLMSTGSVGQLFGNRQVLTLNRLAKLTLPTLDYGEWDDPYKYLRPTLTAAYSEENLPDVYVNHEAAADVYRNFQRAGRQTLQAADPPHSVPPSYPKDGCVDPLDTSLQRLAALLLDNRPVRMAAVEFGGWDHHHSIQKGFTSQLEILSNALSRFFRKLKSGSLQRSVTLVTVTEFGRRIAANASAGTDHGYGSAMIVASHSADGGTGVKGGQLYGVWPTDLDYREGDLKVTTDYRHVLGEILNKRCGVSIDGVNSLFPELGYKALGLLA